MFGSKNSGKKFVRYIATGNNYQESIYYDNDNNNLTSFLCCADIKQKESFYKKAIQIVEIES